MMDGASEDYGGYDINCDEIETPQRRFFGK